MKVNRASVHLLGEKFFFLALFMGLKGMDTSLYMFFISKEKLRS
jgi:hypothetical protein